MVKAPKLRFKEFSESWQTIKLNSLLSFNNGINADKDSYGYGRKFINVLDILNNNFILYEDIIGSVSVNSKTEETNKVEFGDLLFLRSSETREDVGKSSVYLDKDNYALFGGFVIRGKKIGEYDPYFIKLNLESPRVRNQIGSRAGGSTRFNVSQSILANVEINMPSIDEQKKVANFITVFDRKIKKQEEKVELLRKQKNGLMQKIFSKELRFKNENGKEFPNWESVFLSDLILNRKKGNKSTLSESERGSILLDNDYMENGVPPKRVLEEPDVTKENLLILWDGSQAGKSYIGFEGVLGSTFVSLTFEDSLTAEYTYYYLNFYLERIQLSWREGSGVPHVASDFIKKFSIPIPTLAEQERIVSLLKLVERKVLLEEEKIESLNIKKKGFLQQMFI